MKRTLVIGALCTAASFASPAWGQDGSDEIVYESTETTVTVADDSSTPSTNRPSGGAGRFVSYDQQDWGSRIASTGCGPTSLAMIGATLLHNRRITPATVARLLTPRYYIRGSGTTAAAMSAFGRHYGFKVRRASFATAARLVASGGMAVAHAHAGYFTAGGHYLVLRAVKKGRFRIADSNRRGRHGDSERRWWRGETLRRFGVDKVWVFSTH